MPCKTGFLFNALKYSEKHLWEDGNRGLALEYSINPLLVGM